MRSRRKHKGGLVEVGTLLEGALQQLGMKGVFEKHRLGVACREVLGEAFSRALTDVTMKGSALQLSFNHSIWINEANFRKAEILRKIQQALPQAGVRSITLNLSAPRKPSGK